MDSCSFDHRGFHFLGVGLRALGCFLKRFSILGAKTHPKEPSSSMQVDPRGLGLRV